MTEGIKYRLIAFAILLVFFGGVFHIGWKLYTCRSIETIIIDTRSPRIELYDEGGHWIGKTERFEDEIVVRIKRKKGD